ncbi:glycine zipper 2TM domain-containing protein [Achromobacter insuavis]|uniref:Rickettsia 17 kDa surface antigen family protein 1 n=1 Tax=Achromobacter insuavis AXX-A TaxID=1003200 RepID=F7T091_9BURK|nr:glycine zipper 2TM domain-containing protein [Achromobacter insuavis]EGP46180.1 rickettsia 17 kDa surface antigen family protein 1 [Achromobacter insuavis AXX-A]
MNNPVQSDSARRGLHPLVSAAAIAVIVMCSVGVAAVLGWLPTPSATPHPEDPALAQAGPEGVNLAPVQPGAPGQPQAPGARPPAAQAQPQAQGRPAPAPAVPAAQACRTCGVVETIRQVQVPVKDNSDHLVGTIAGGVAGGVVGNQFGGGSGKTALTVLGAVGGALAGREVERNIRQQQTVTHYELTVRMNDGSTRQFRSAQPFAFASGDHVRVENNQLLPG